MQVFQNYSRLSELISLKYAFNISFKITRKSMIMGTSSEFHDGIQLNILPTLSLEILLLSLAQKKPLRGLGDPFKIIMETLKYNSTNFLRLTLNQSGKAIGLSATPVAY